MMASTEELYVEREAYEKAASAFLSSDIATYRALEIMDCEDVERVAIGTQPCRHPVQRLMPSGRMASNLIVVKVGQPISPADVEHLPEDVYEWKSRAEVLAERHANEAWRVATHMRITQRYLEVFAPAIERAEASLGSGHEVDLRTKCLLNESKRWDELLNDRFGDVERIHETDNAWIETRKSHVDTQRALATLPAVAPLRTRRVARGVSRERRSSRTHASAAAGAHSPPDRPAADDRPRRPRPLTSGQHELADRCLDAGCLEALDALVAGDETEARRILDDALEAGR